jgi:hypothetical protein
MATMRSLQPSFGATKATAGGVDDTCPPSWSCMSAFERSQQACDEGASTAPTTTTPGLRNNLAYAYAWVCQTNGVTRVEGNYLRPAARRPSKAISNAFNAGFHRIVQRLRPAPVGSKLMIAM